MQNDVAVVSVKKGDYRIFFFFGTWAKKMA